MRWRQNMFRSINSTDDKADLLLDNQCLLPSTLFSLSLSLSYTRRLVSQVNWAYGKEQEVLKWNQCRTGTFFIHVNTWRPSIYYTHKLKSIITNKATHWETQIKESEKCIGSPLLWNMSVVLFCLFSFEITQLLSLQVIRRLLLSETHIFVLNVTLKLFQQILGFKSIYASVFLNLPSPYCCESQIESHISYLKCDGVA